jgi:hypothetical protein
VTFFWIAVAVIALSGALVWIGLLLWAARADGRDEAASRREHDKDGRK